MHPEFSQVKVPSAPAFIDALKGHCVRAFSDLYNDYSGALLYRITKMTNDADLSQDILQSAFIKIWQNIGAYEPGKGSLFTWMLTICRHQVIDMNRQHNCGKNLMTTEYVKSVAILGNNPAPSRIDVSYYLTSLQPRDRVIIDLIYFQGFTNAETARLLSIPEGTLKTRVRSIFRKWRSQRECSVLSDTF